VCTLHDATAIGLKAAVVGGFPVVQKSITMVVMQMQLAITARYGKALLTLQFSKHTAVPWRMLCIPELWNFRSWQREAAAVYYTLLVCCGCILRRKGHGH
jgi:hypothetical protein